MNVLSPPATSRPGAPGSHNPPLNRSPSPSSHPPRQPSPHKKRPSGRGYMRGVPGTTCTPLPACEPRPSARPLALRSSTHTSTSLGQQRSLDSTPRPLTTGRPRFPATPNWQTSTSPPTSCGRSCPALSTSTITTSNCSCASWNGSATTPHPGSPPAKSLSQVSTPSGWDGTRRSSSACCSRTRTKPASSAPARSTLWPALRKRASPSSTMRDPRRRASHPKGQQHGCRS